MSEVDDKLRSILSMEEVKNEEEYIMFFKPENLPKNLEKIDIIEALLKESIETEDFGMLMIIMNIIPMDADILYYYKINLEYNLIDENCFLKIPKISPNTIIFFYEFIKTHVKAEKDFEEIGKEIPTDFYTYSDKFMFCDSNDVNEYTYCGSLSKILSYKLLTIVNDDCKSYSGKPSLKGLACSFNKSYVPVPQTADQLDIFKHIIDVKLASGVNGAVFEGTTNQELQVITKIPLRHSARTLFESVVSLCIINKYIDEFPELRHAYNYCYGLFTCPSFTVDEPSEIKKKICSTHDGNPEIFEVYSKVKGNTLSDLLIKNELFDETTGTTEITVEKFKIIFKKLLIQLIILQEGPYKFTHSDLHSGNVMISKLDSDSPVVTIIDYGMSSFEMSGMKYPNWFEIEFLGNLEKHNIVTGLYDINFFLQSIIGSTKNNTPLNKYAKKVLYHIVLPKNLFVNKETSRISHDILFSQKYLYRFEDIKGIEKNLKIFESLTYLQIYKNIMDSEFKFDSGPDISYILNLYRVDVLGPKVDGHSKLTGVGGEGNRNKKILRKWIHNIMGENGNMEYESFIFNLIDKYALVDVKQWLPNNIQLKAASCMYMASLIFDKNIIFTPEFLSKSSARVFSAEELELETKNLLDVLGIWVLP